MKNWDNANVPGYGGTPTECYIEDIENLVKDGHQFIFQRTPTHYQIIKTKVHPREIKLMASLQMWIPLFQSPEDFKKEHPGLNYNEETYQCYWNDGPILKNWPIHYQWEISNPADPTTLIWWDHDLGDVVLDCLGPEDMQDIDQYDRITDNVYFYWIT